MTHIPHLIIDLALILCSAGVVTLLFKKLKQPLVLGYIIAGLLVGPNFKFFFSVTDITNVEIWAEIGVIVLLFTLGLEFSFKKLVKVGGQASITAFVQIICMIVLGYISGRFLGWSEMDSIFLGAILSMSSTTIILRAFEELGVKGKKFASIVFGALIVEDLVAIVLMVLLSTIAVSQQFAGSEMLQSILKLIFFLLLWFLAGIFFIPTLLKKTKKLMNDETMLLVSLSLCFIMVVLASQAGFSPALGAFVMGSILAETTQAERIEHLVMSIKYLFGAIFFVSVGMLINPSMLVEYAWPILIVTLITLFGKMLFTGVGALVSGQPLKQSVQAGMSLAQIGEFSFIIATLGLTLKVTSPFLYPVIVAVSGITTFTTPYMIRLSEPMNNWLEKVIPKRTLDALNRYSTGAQYINAESDWKIVLKAFVQVVVFNMVICIAIVLVFTRFVSPLFIIWGFWGNVLTAVLAFVVMAPFLYVLTARKIRKQAYTQLWLYKYNRGPIIGMEILRVAVGVILVGLLLDQIFSTITALVVSSSVLLVVILVFRRRLNAFSNKIEKRFMLNLNMRESMQQDASSVNSVNSVNHLLPWDAHMAHFDIEVDSVLVGKSLEKLALREKFGINLAMIERGERTIMVPTKDEKLFPFDRIAIIGTDEQIAKFGSEIEAANKAQVFDTSEGDVTLTQIKVNPWFPYLGKTIRESNLRVQVNGLIVGIERKGERILNPDSTMKFEIGDTLWIVGDKKKVKTVLGYPPPVKV